MYPDEVDKQLIFSDGSEKQTETWANVCMIGWWEWDAIEFIVGFSLSLADLVVVATIVGIILKWRFKSFNDLE